MRVLVVGEGPGDVGVRDHWCARTRTRVTLPGWLSVLLEKLGPTDIEITAIMNRDIPLTDQQKRKNMPLPDGHGAKAMAAKFKAKFENYDVIVFMADPDTKEETDWNLHHTQIKNGFGRFIGGPAEVVCLPKSASESWLLADRDAWTAIGLDVASLLPQQPENIWGKRNDPMGNHPHRYFARICDTAGVSDDRATRVALAREMSAATLAKSCPLSFGAFWTELQEAGIAAAL